ncbi:hypothetical protein [Rhodococcus opacus]|uniref:Uncharacterized protein n=1 Tax=Rhodococcus opacus TaxID=37919 RepID=A0AAX3YR29_RHOOP|nr:hypothetical protein [Rhodococcus opacus]MDV6247299.1 hypothetical protein [Rhodococcus opacus]MDX5964462.1 hypothetical protein [Rhodococcus opacus]NKY72786.1 hypothetical protein [Rhodococcus opacus]WLF50497.1 hypothetical protein Q5707_16615 [Rhodococcus opacus]
MGGAFVPADYPGTATLNLREASSSGRAEANSPSYSASSSFRHRVTIGQDRTE